MMKHIKYIIFFTKGKKLTITYYTRQQSYEYNNYLYVLYLQLSASAAL